MRTLPRSKKKRIIKKWGRITGWYKLLKANKFYQERMFLVSQPDNNFIEFTARKTFLWDDLYHYQIKL